MKFVAMCDVYVDGELTVSQGMIINERYYRMVIEGNPEIRKAFAMFETMDEAVRVSKEQTRARYEHIYELAGVVEEYNELLKRL